MEEKIEANELKQYSHQLIKSISQNKISLNQDYKLKNYSKSQNIPYHSAVILLLFFQLIPLVSSQTCLEFKGNICVRCPQNTHLYRGDCYFSVPFCVRYINGMNCAFCEDNYSPREDRTSCIKKDRNLISQQNKIYQLVISQFPEPHYTLTQLLKKSLTYQKITPQPPKQISQTTMPFPETFNNQINFIQIQKQNYVRYFSQQLRQKTLLQLPPTLLLKLVRLYKGTQSNINEIGNPYRAIFQINNGYIDILYRIKQARKSQKQTKSQKKFTDLKLQNLQLKQPVITIYMIKILTFNQKNLKIITEPYKDLQIIDIKRYITDKYSNIWPKIAQTQILASYKGKDNSTKKYVVYLLQKNFGLLQIQLHINEENYKPTTKVYKKQQIPEQIIMTSKTIEESNYFKPYLKDVQIYSIAQVQYDNNFIAYNVTYIHNSMNAQQNNKKSYYVFDFSPKQPLIYIRSMYLLLKGFQNYEIKNYRSMISRFGDMDSFFHEYSQSNANQNQQILFFYSAQPITVQISQNIMPNNKQITVPINFVEILNTRQFQISSVYNAILEYIKRINPIKQLSHLQKLIVFENSSHTIYELTYIPQKDQQNIYFSFYKFMMNKTPLSNGSRLLEFVEYYRVPYNERLIIKLNDRNREQIINNFTETQKFILNLIKNQSLYEKDSLLLQVTTRNYTSSPQQALKSKIHTFKYYLPPQLNKTYQFIQFRYIQLYRSFDKYIKSCGHVITPKQKFAPIDAKTRGRILLFLNYYSIFHVINQESINYFQLMDSYVSVDRPNYYRIGVLINNKSLYLCEVYQRFLKEYLILSITSKMQSQIDRNIPQKYSNYPIKIFQDNWKSIKQEQIQSTLSSDIKDMIILIFYQSNFDVVVYVKKQDEMLGLYDRFQIQFVENNELNKSNRYKLVFQAPKNISNRPYPSEANSNTSGISSNQNINKSQPENNTILNLNSSKIISNISKINQTKENTSSMSAQSNLSNLTNQANEKIEIKPTAADQKVLKLINQSVIEAKLVMPELRNNDTKTALPLGLTPPNATNFTTFTVREPLGSLPRLQGTVISLVNSENQNSPTAIENLTSVPLIAASIPEPPLPISISSTASNSSTNTNILQDKLHNFMQNAFNIRPLSFYSEIQHSFIDMIIFKDPISALNDTKALIQSMFFNSNNSDIQIIVETQRQSIMPPVKMIDIQIKSKSNAISQNKNHTNEIPYRQQLTQKLRIWISQTNKLIKIQTKQDGTTKQFKQINSKILQDNSYLIQIQRIGRKQIINTMRVIGSSSISIFGYQAGTDFAKNMQIDYNNIIYLKQKRISDILQVQIYYQLNQILIKTIISSKISQNTIQYNILSTNIYANGLKQLKELNKDYRIKVLSQLKKTNQFSAVLDQIIKQYGKFQDEDVIDISVRVVNKYFFYQILHIVKNKYYFISAIYDTTKKKLSGINFSPYTQNSLQKDTKQLNREQKIQKLKNKAVQNSIKLIKGCKLKILGSLQCLQCQSEYYMGQNYQCYPHIRGCQVQSGILCVLCSSGYIDTGNFSCQ